MRRSWNWQGLCRVADQPLGLINCGGQCSSVLVSLHWPQTLPCCVEDCRLICSQPKVSRVLCCCTLFVFFAKYIRRFKNTSIASRESAFQHLMVYKAVVRSVTVDELSISNPNVVTRCSRRFPTVQ